MDILTHSLTHSLTGGHTYSLANYLLTYLLIERARLHQDIINDARTGRLDASSTNDAVKPTISLSDAIKREEGDTYSFICLLTYFLTYSLIARLIEDYNRNWFEYEGFNLKEAFKSQTAKVNADWETHETSITDEYNNKRKLLTKVVFTRSLTHSLTHSHSLTHTHSLIYLLTG